MFILLYFYPEINLILSAFFDWLFDIAHFLKSSLYLCLKVAEAALFRSCTEIEEDSLLNLCSEPKKSSSCNTQDANRANLNIFRAASD